MPNTNSWVRNCRTFSPQTLVLVVFVSSDNFQLSPKQILVSESKISGNFVLTRITYENILTYIFLHYLKIAKVIEAKMIYYNLLLGY
jgi:D-arabinose 1-dehydrogenase-like Zn-dependent alcohol dehydrogenase